MLTKAAKKGKKTKEVTISKKKKEVQPASSDEESEEESMDEEEVPEPMKPKTKSIKNGKSKKAPPPEEDDEEDEDDDEDEEEEETVVKKKAKAQKDKKKSKAPSPPPEEESEDDDDSEEETPVKKVENDDDDDDDDSEEEEDAKPKKRKQENSDSTPSKKAKSDEPVSLFVGGLDFETSTDTIKKFFADNDVELSDVRKREGKRFGHVDLANNDDVDKALKLHGSEVDGCEIRIDKADRPKGGDRNEGGPKGKTLTARNLSFDTTEDTLKDAFEGAISVRIPTFPDSGKSRGRGFIDFESTEAAETALKEMNETDLDGRRIYVEFAHERGGFRSERGGSRGGGGGFRGGRDGGRDFGGRGGRGGGFRGGRGGRGGGGGYGGGGRSGGYGGGGGGGGGGGYNKRKTFD